jgi:hypothetical protein
MFLNKHITMTIQHLHANHIQRERLGTQRCQARGIRPELSRQEERSMHRLIKEQHYADAHMDLSLEPRTRLSSPRTIGRKKPPSSKLSTSSGEYACTTRCTKPFHVSLPPGNVLYTDEAVKTYHSPHIGGCSHQTLEIYIAERRSDLQPEGVFRISAGCPNFVVTPSGSTRLCESGQHSTPDVATRALYAPALSAKAIRWDSLWSSSVSVIHT